MKIFRNANGCDDTSEKLQCGRFNEGYDNGQWTDIEWVAMACDMFPVGECPTKSGCVVVGGKCDYGENVHDCSASNTVSVSGSCKCGDQICANGQFCYDGGCHNNAKLPSCGEDGANAVAGSCKCGGSTCLGGQYCYDGGCHDVPQPAERTCVPTAKPEGALDIYPINSNTDKPGKYFQFDLKKGQDFFDYAKVGWRYGSKYCGAYKILNSCGEIQDIEVMRNARNCDNTSNKLQCARVHTNTWFADEGDWNYPDTRGPTAVKWIAKKWTSTCVPQYTSLGIEVGSTVYETDMFSFGQMMVFGICAAAFAGGYYYGMKPKGSTYERLVDSEH